MDLGIKGKWALVGGASKGLGFGCAQSLAREGAHVVIVARGAEALEAAAIALRKFGTTILPVAVDITTPEGRDAVWSVAGGPGKDFDIVVTNAGGPPPGDFRNWDREAWLKAVDANMLTPIELIKATVDGMAARKFGRIVNITSAMVKSPRPHQALSTSARTGLTAFSKSLSFEVAADNVTLNNILPERIDTPRQEFLARRQAEINQISYEEARAKFASSIAAKRFGTPEEFADAVAYLCSAQAGFISGQNLQLDGGSYPGLM